MSITEMIKRLTLLKEEYGDLDVEAYKGDDWGSVEGFQYEDYKEHKLNYDVSPVILVL